MAGGTTGVLDASSDLVRKGWTAEGLIQKKANSFWAPYTGRTPESVVYQKNVTDVKEGHTMVFDYTGNIASEAIRGKEQAYGKGVSKKKFSDKFTIERLRWVVDNGDKFDGVNIGDLSITQHSDSLSQLGDLFVRAKDQILFDAAQGRLRSDSLTTVLRPTSHTVASGNLDASDAMSYDFLTELEYQAKTGFGGTRAPILPVSFSQGEPVWILVCDSVQTMQLKNDSDFRTIVSQADVRGVDNRLLSSVAGKIGNFVIVEAPRFFGTSSSRQLGKNVAEVAGLRQVDEAGLFTGETSFSTSGDTASRGFIMGKGALKLGFGQLPDYKFQQSSDFGITSESALETWMQADKVQLVAENTDYSVAKLDGLDYGIAGFETVALSGGTLIKEKA